jgi:hypothetical protein
MNISQKNHWYGTDEIDRKHHDWLLITFVMIQICFDQDRQRENIKPFNWSKNNKMHTYTFKDEGVGCLKMTPIATCSPGLSWRYSRSNCRERERDRSNAMHVYCIGQNFFNGASSSFLSTTNIHVCGWEKGKLNSFDYFFHHPSQSQVHAVSKKCSSSLMLRKQSVRVAYVRRPNPDGQSSMVILNR